MTLSHSLRTPLPAKRKQLTTALEAMMLAMLLPGLVGCGSGGSSQTTPDQTAQTPSYSLVAPETNNDFETYIKTALTNANQASPMFMSTFDGIMDDVAEVADSGASASSDGSFSTTYLQETGVDEADLMKFDGSTLYIVNQPEVYAWTEPALAIDDIALDSPVVESSLATIRVMAVEDDPASAAEIATLTLEPFAHHQDITGGGRSNIKGIYLNNDQLTVLTGQPHYVSWDAYHYWSGGAIGIQTFNTSNPEDITEGGALLVEGAYLVGSRRIGDALYLVTRSTPYLPGFVWYAEDDVQIAKNQTMIDALDIEQLLPKVRMNNGDAQLLVSPQSCLLPEDSTDKSRASYYTPEILTIVRIDLNDLSKRESLCTAAPTQGIYMSTQALYLFGSQSYYHFNDQPTTAIHKFSITGDETSYRGSGAVPGMLGWQNPSYRFGEQKDHLVVISSDAATNEAIPNDTGHRLTVLAEVAGENSLQQVAQLPSVEQPTVLGKPNESIYGVRIMGNRAYAVTFLRTDPLYVIDIEDPSEPAITGSLELPGFSDFLHPIGESLLLGIGQDADQAGRTQGVKVNLFDITDTENPQTVKSIALGDRYSYTAVSSDPKAFSALQLHSDEMRFTLPISLYEGDADPQWQYSGLELFTINGLEALESDLSEIANVNLTHQGTLKRSQAADTQSGDSAWLNPIERGILFNDSVHYVSGDSVWSASWQTPESDTGEQ